MIILGTEVKWGRGNRLKFSEEWSDKMSTHEIPALALSFGVAMGTQLS